MGVALEEVVRSGISDPGWSRRYIRAAVGMDIICGVVAIQGVVLVRIALGIAHPVEIPLGLAITTAWPLTLALVGGYDRRNIGDGADEYRKVIHSAGILASVVAITAYVTQTSIARSYVMAGIPICALLTLGVRYGMRKRLHRRRRAGECLRRVVVVGHWTSVLELHGQFSRERYHGMRIVAACVPPDQAGQLPAQVDGFPVLGDFKNVPEVVVASQADSVAVLACPELDGHALRRLAWQLEDRGTELLVATALMEVAGPRINIRPVAGLALLHVEHPDIKGIRQVIKSVFDRVMATVALLMLLPFMLALAAAIRISSPGPALFRQARVGKGGEEFTVYKFRTMTIDAESRKITLRTFDDDGNGVLFKLRNDPRVTPLGTWLRRYSLDELTQLINVVKGEMSLVGPRPPLPEEVAQYGDDVRRRLLVKPGMTGLWQVSGRSDLTWEESVRLDLRYVENWSLTLDVLILWKTWSAVFGGRGAY
ncbi:sugar transferase [Herbidospora mongoliensis]|uniref:sugar transferase n=1 Tax=Herbidospora mongoliensis TaxID=688067 RepID=UPI00082B3981|nr:sugar transferase [Herbidospora mongoliensis]